MQSVSFIRDLYSSIYAVIKRETCVSIRFTALDIEISTKFNYFKWRFIYTGYIIFYIKYNEIHPYVFLWLDFMIYLSI